MSLHFLQPETKKSPVAWCEKSSAAAEDVKSESKWKKHDHPTLLRSTYAAYRFCWLENFSNWSQVAF